MLEIPFVLNGRGGTVSVEYGENTDIVRSGFDMFDPGDFDPSIALGYPTMRAWVKDYAGSGYRLASGWIQLLYAAYWDAQGNPAGSEVSIDGKNGGNPYFAFGYPSTIYDAPANNLNGSARMTWRAETFFVTMPARWNEFTVASLCGFRWGYDDAMKEADRHEVVLSPLQELTVEDWARALPVLERECPDYRFVRQPVERAAR